MKASLDIGSTFSTDLQTALIENDLMLAIEMCKDEKNNGVIQENPWEILPSITTHICETDELEDEDKIKVCTEILNIVTNKCMPEDVVLVLHKEISYTKDEKTFTALLVPLQTALCKTPITKFKYSVWCFDAIQSYVNQLPNPENLNLEGAERILMDTDADVYRISNLYRHIFKFYKEIGNDIKKKASIENQSTFLKYILQLLGQPLVYLDLEIVNNTKSSGRLVAEDIVELICYISNPFIFLQWKKYVKSLDDDLEISKLAIANFYYLLLCENVADKLKPKIYSNIYILQNGLVFVDELFQHEHQFIVEKGIKLCEKLLNDIPTHSLSYELLDNEIHSKFCVSISKVIIHNPLKNCRQHTLEIFHKYLFSFDTKGRYLLIYNLIHVLNHTGLIGYLITQYKNMLVYEFDQQCLFNKYLSGTKLISLLNCFCYLHKKEESDLLELADQIVPALNLLRYLAIRDKDNVTKVWDHFPTLSIHYFEPLKKGLIMSKAHYELKTKELEEEAAKGDKKDANVSVTIAGQKLANMSVGEKLNVVKSSVTAFDVMESLLGRVNEFIDSGLH